MQLELTVSAQSTNETTGQLQSDAENRANQCVCCHPKWHRDGVHVIVESIIVATQHECEHLWRSKDAIHQVKTYRAGMKHRHNDSQQCKATTTNESRAIQRPSTG